MASLNRFQLTLVLLGLSVLFFGAAEKSNAETLIYSNTIDQNAWWPPVNAGYGEIIDFGTTSGGNVCRFRFGYVTTRSDPGVITINFYSGINDYEYEGYHLKKFIFSNLQGSPTNGLDAWYVHNYWLTKDEQFTIPAGDFGYSFEFSNENTGVWLAGGGSGNIDGFYIEHEIWGWTLLNFDTYPADPWAGFYMEIYEGEIPPASRIRGYKFNDTDGNGSWDDGEPTMPGWEIFLDENDNGKYDYDEPNCITDQTGMYEFDTVKPGAYNVGEVLKDGWVQTCPGGDGMYPVVVDVNEVFTFNFGNYEGQLLLELSGHVLTDEDGPVEDVLMSASTGQSTMTDEFGYYKLSLPAPWWSGTISPSKECFSFDPAERSYSSLLSNLTDQDFTAIPLCFYGGGTGTEDDPYLIYTAEHMQEIGTHPEHWSSHFKLMNDIDLGAYIDDSFNIIGYFVTNKDNQPFAGVFDGNNHRIYNFTYITDAIGAACMGLFGFVNNPSAEINNLILVTPFLDAEDCISVGSLVGDLNLGTVRSCAVWDGIVVGYGNVGGLVGNLGNGTVLDSYARCAVAGETRVGGLIGYNRNELLRCYSVSDVSGLSDVGAVIGSNEGMATGCFYDSDISMLPGIGEGDTGGVIGETTENMQSEATFTDVGWDFNDVWDICEGTNYPKFIWHKTPLGDLVCPDGVEVADFAIISAYLLQNDCGACGAADFSGDGDVGLPDVEIFVDNWMMGVGI